MPSLSYNFSARLAKTLGSGINRVWSGRVSKSTRRRATSTPAEGLGLVRPEPAARSPSSTSSGDDGPERQIRQEQDRFIKQEDQYEHSFTVREEDQDYGLGAESDDEFGEEEAFEDSLSHSQSGVPMHGLGDMDKPIQSIEADDESSDSQGGSPSLRGGRRRPMDRDTSEEDEHEDKKEGQNEDEDDIDYEQPPIDLDRFYDSEEEFEAEYDVNSADLDWYRVERTRVPHFRDWAGDAAKAHKLMTLCGQYSLLPSSWECDLVDHPFLHGLFAPMEAETKTLIRAESNQFRATRALRNLFELHIRICAYRQDGLHGKIGDLIDKEIRRYDASVEKDAKLLGSYAYSSPIMIIKFSTLQYAEVDKDELQARVHQQAMQSCRKRVEEYRNWWDQQGIEHYPRVMYAFVIIQQTVQIWAIDTEIPVELLENPHPLRSIDMSKRNDWLNCTLSIAIPIHLAKESLAAHRWNFPKVEVEESDTDR
ncbi:hypothetical protein Daus18300_001612 [Diaporthe australafricana]|uniref:Uncharacterized protein n=1 Tax=Diaporthe australafricana TaxID=127596 RepID=A0ABR3XUU3_9PEZI